MFDGGLWTGIAWFGRSTMIEINLLPWREDARRQNTHQFWRLALGGALLACLVVFLMAVSIRKKIHQQAAINQQWAIQAAHVSDALKTKPSRNIPVTALQRMNDMHRSRVRMIHFLASVEAFLPPGVHLNRFETHVDELRVFGIAESASALSSFMHNMEDAGWIKAFVIHDAMVLQRSSLQIPAIASSKAFKLRIVLRDVKAK